MSSLVKILRRAKTLVWTAFSIIVIFLALIVGLGELFLPYSAHYQDRLETWLSSELDQPVEIESFTGEWNAFGPQLELKGLKLLDAETGDATSVVDEAVIDIKPFNVFFPARALYNFRVVGANFDLKRLEDGSFEFSGFGVTPRTEEREAGGESALKQLATINEVILENSSLHIEDRIHDLDFNLRAINGRLQVRGDEISIEISTSLTQRSSGEVYGEFEATGKILLDGESRPASAMWQFSGHELVLDQLSESLPDNEYVPQQGTFNTDLWGVWSREDQHLVRGVIDLRSARLANEHMDRSIDRMNTRFILEFSNLDEWRMDLDELELDDGVEPFTIQSIALGRNIPLDTGLWVSADTVPVRFPAQIARDVVSMVGRDWPRYIPGEGTGQVHNFEMVLNPRMRLGHATGTFTQASVGDWNIWPDIANVDGRLEFGPGFGSLVLDGKGVEVEWPRMFTAPLTLDLPACTVRFGWTPGVKGQYQVGIEQCSVENEFVAASGDMHFRGNTGKPAVDVVVHADRLDVAAVGNYWPRALLKPTATEWLRDSLLTGELESGRLQIYGDMDHWPFDQGEGRFETIANFKNADIDYFEGWPRANGVDGVALFVNSGMDVVGSVNDIGGLSTPTIRAQVSDFRTPELTVDYQANSDLPGILAFLEQTPVRENVGVNLEQFDFVGDASTTGTLFVPLSQGSDGFALDGRLALQDNQFIATDYDFSLNAISGELIYHQAGFYGEDLSAEYRGKPAILAMQAGGDPDVNSGQAAAIEAQPGETTVEIPAAEPVPAFTASLEGRFGLADLLPETILDDWSSLNQIQGESIWNVEFSAGGDVTSEISLGTNLEGISLGLPAPLEKPASESWPFEMAFPLGVGEKTIEFGIPGRLDARFVMNEAWQAPSRGAITLGTGRAQLPEQGFLTLGGEADYLDLDDWVSVVTDEVRDGKSLSGLVLQPGVFNAREMLFLDRHFQDVELTFTTLEDEFDVIFDAETIKGKVAFVGVGGTNQSLSAEFDRLVLDKAVSSGMQIETDPALLPDLHLYAQSLSYSGIELGETRIEAYPTAEGLHFEKVQTESEHLNIDASGDWSQDENGHKSSFDIHMTSESLGDFLRQLDIATPVEGGQTLVNFEVWWDGSPGQFGLARLNGEVDFSVNTGVIKDASPGTGRLLGLLAVQALPRRLALDFRDVFDSGFVFDEANGSFQMLNGSARTDDVLLKSSAANISFSGTTNLVAREYDQLITVRPGLGNTLPIIGAIAGGPTGAAAGLALQGLLHDELGEASQVQYTLTGGWDEPLIEPVIDSSSDG